MEISFSKYSGCGNDFILIDNRIGNFPVDSPSLISKLCHRHEGVGADGIILLENSTFADYRMRIFNSDGGEAGMCGNGIRCLMKFLPELGIEKICCTIQTMHDTHILTLVDGKVQVEMPPPKDVRWGVQVPYGSERLSFHFLNTGVPHVVHFIDSIEEADMTVLAPHIRWHAYFAPEGVNVNYATVDCAGKIHVRTFERGVEKETQACGTGAAATALAAAKYWKLASPVKVNTRSGELLEFFFESKDDEIISLNMIGPAHMTFQGKVKFTID